MIKAILFSVCLLSLAARVEAASLSGVVKYVRVNASNGTLTVVLESDTTKYHDLSYSAAASPTLLSMAMASKASGIPLILDFTGYVSSRATITSARFN